MAVQSLQNNLRALSLQNYLMQIQKTQVVGVRQGILSGQMQGKLPVQALILRVNYLQNLQTYLVNAVRLMTLITREQAEKCIELISSVKDDIIESFPSTNTLRCRQGVAKDTHCITVLRQLLRYYNKRLISQRTKVPRTKGCKMHYTYKIAI